MEHDYKALWEYEMKITAELRQQIDGLEKTVTEKEDACERLETSILGRDEQISELEEQLNDNAEFISYLTGQLIAYRHTIGVMFGGKVK